MKLEKVHHESFIVLVKIPFWTPNSTTSPNADQIAFWWHAQCHTTLSRKWEHSFGNTSNFESPYDTKEIFFFSLILYFLSSIFPFYFTLKIAAQISGGPMCVRKTFYLLSAPTICTSHYAPDMLGIWNDLQKKASGNSLGIMCQPLKL